MADGCLLYYITDRRQFPGDEAARRQAVLAKISEAASAGVDYIQLREKDLCTGDLGLFAGDAVRTLVELKATQPGLKTRLLINSRTDVALATGADGVHLRAEDLLPHEVRDIVRRFGGRQRIPHPFFIAMSCHSAADVVRAQSEGANFAVFAPVYEKQDQPGTKPAGLRALQEACVAQIPVFALGGVTVENAAACIKAGAAGIAAIRLFQENKIADVVSALKLVAQRQTR